MVSAMRVFAPGEKIARHFNPYNNRAFCGYYIIGSKERKASCADCVIVLWALGNHPARWEGTLLTPQIALRRLFPLCRYVKIVFHILPVSHKKVLFKGSIETIQTPRYFRRVPGAQANGYQAGRFRNG
jgi:hypothetical protein